MLVDLRAIERHVDDPSPRGRALGVRGLLKEAIDRIDDSAQQEAARRLFGLATGTRALNWGGRENKAAKALNLGRDAFRKRRPRSHGDRLIAAVAEEIFLLEREYLARERWQARRSELAGIAYEPTRAQIDLYTAMGGHVFAAAAELASFAEKMHAGDVHPEQESWNDNLRSALFEYVCFSCAQERHIDLFSHRWGLTRAEAEKEFVTLLHTITLEQPLSMTEESWLRVQISDIKQPPELSSFLELLESAATGVRIQEKWKAWATACDCHPKNPLQSCALHRFIRTGFHLYDIFNEELKAVEDFGAPSEALSQESEGGIATNAQA